MIAYRILHVSDAHGELCELPHAVARHIKEKKRDGAQSESLAAYLLLRTLGEENGIPDILSQLRFDGGMPTADGVYVSLSHAGGLVAAAIADTPVGIDIEPIRHLPRRDALGTRYFSPEERERLIKAPDAQKDEIFFRIFTEKEAYAKANGLSLAATVGRDLSHDTPYAQAVARYEKNGILYVITVILA